MTTLVIDLKKLEKNEVDAKVASIESGVLKAMLAEIMDRTGSLDLAFLAQWEAEAAREWLRTLPAVGPKTAACVLLFGLGKPGLPVDTHVHRVAGKLGLIDIRLTPEKAQTLLEGAVPEADHYRLTRGRCLGCFDRGLGTWQT